MEKGQLQALKYHILVILEDKITNKKSRLLLLLYLNKGLLQIQGVHYGKQ
ncbi:hypothetical protein Loa_01052 [Legionella oakridgensis ATCC 33761 = DSM 21215]|uniref:Uncharacterized protein n=1 Tax=Legionella oakridgensis ATCC 33761 = DSM 21215 TaxID=1268635 RepID=W0B7U1_9GAMM|nr:hypothetical protein Loa_01052 [Legionella oakridgensis ATCC 33761 = DSM 21215]ETO93693.1 hypothetical protein LOR_56c12640 [Legionella oakridgensis RV-2-2007]STY19751.1 Uncharacterised protein [Legionella longbeachae]